MQTTVVNVRMHKYDVYMGRAGRGSDGYFGNPVAIGKRCPICSKWHVDGGSTLPCYRKYFIDRLNNDSVFWAEISKLKGKRLACFCVRKEWQLSDGGVYVCHAQVVAEHLDGGNPYARTEV